VELINRLTRAIEAGSFVSPKWVLRVCMFSFSCDSSLLFQMAGTAGVLKGINRLKDVHYPVLVPNQKGLEDLVALLETNPSTPPLTDEISVFMAATDAFTCANLNCSRPIVRETLSGDACNIG